VVETSLVTMSPSQGSLGCEEDVRARVLHLAALERDLTVLLALEHLEQRRGDDLVGGLGGLLDLAHAQGGEDRGVAGGEMRCCAGRARRASSS
jgi:hypothetical protein